MRTNKLTKRDEGIYRLSLTHKKFKSHIQIIKFKQVGRMCPYYKYPDGNMGLWVYPTQWKLNLHNLIRTKQK